MYALNVLKNYYKMQVYSERQLDGSITVAVTGQFVDDMYASKDDLRYVKSVNNYKRFSQFIRLVRDLIKTMNKEI